ncbi:MAG: glycoside hydrolase family 28 [Gemmatimonadetes bacterium]|nr:glycoside hydrolase family 28 [Gemmatimonadota bacterium]
MTSPSRRDFLRAVAGAAGSIAVLPHLGNAAAFSTVADDLAAEADGWARVPGILARIKPPTFPKRDFAITRYGAVAGGAIDCTAAIRDAIAACAKAGGGRVVVDGGVFLTGPVVLESKVNLHVARGATLRFTRETAKYLPAVLTRFEGTEIMNYSPFIYAFEASDIAITGEGTLDGNADARNWWLWKGGNNRKPGDPDPRPAHDRLLRMAEDGVPVAQRVFGEGDFVRPNFIQPYRCKNVLIEGVTIRNSPMWEINPVLCTNVTVRHVDIDSHGPNNDGCDPESCRDVLIEHCTFNTGDDCIAIKSGRNADGRRINVPSENIIIRDCTMKDGHGGVTIGSEISGGVRYVFAERCTMDSTRLDRALRLKNNAMRGGTLEHIYMRDVQVGELADSVLQVDFLYEEGAKGPFVPVVRDVELLRVTSRKSKYGVYLVAYDKATIDDIRLIDCTFDGVAQGDKVDHVTNLTRKNMRMNGAVVQ